MAELLTAICGFEESDQGGDFALDGLFGGEIMQRSSIWRVLKIDFLLSFRR